jgi:hypothetical protein
MKKVIMLVALVLTLALPIPLTGCKGSAGKTAKAIYKGTCTALSWICKYQGLVCAKAEELAAKAKRLQKSTKPAARPVDHMPIKAGPEK